MTARTSCETGLIELCQVSGKNYIKNSGVILSSVRDNEMVLHNTQGKAVEVQLTLQDKKTKRLKLLPYELKIL